MIVFAVDTCSEPGSLVLLREGHLPAVVALPPGRYGTTLHDEIARLLSRCHLQPADITGYAVTSGPGSFTGVRIGLTAVKGLAEAHGKPVVPVSTLQTIAAAAVLAAGLTSPVTLAPLMDARRGQIFGGLYRNDPDQFQTLAPKRVCSLRVFLESVQEAELPQVYFCGTDLERFAPEIEKAGWDRSALISVPPLLAEALAQLAVRKLEKGLGGAAGDGEADYVRPSDAELFWKE